ncbi:substrate-binding domain-containing protein [Kribbella sp.]|uniref:substrate-binding domain-containing protein n=1 Tax=Kribbella sp. TaxID=1871183 RepID=UPI002D3F9334|nr:substrate-binding domain-containing protein [Kribbella sp.]HZX06660.1 substrate-binding domain-containing protein [Kribbella sp.]
MSRRWVAVPVLALGLMVAACNGGAGSGSGSVASDTVIDLAATDTVGPHGEKPTRVTDLELDPADEAKIKSGHYRAALLWHEMSAWSSAVQKGAVDEFARLGIKVVATADAKFDAAAQANQIQTALATKPDVILGQAVDPTTGAAAYQPAVAQGVKLVFADQAPNGFTYGKQYQAIITGDLFQLGRRAAEALGEAMGGKGDVAIMYYDAQFHVTNMRDCAFKKTLQSKFPGLRIVAQQGFSDPNKAEDIANALITQHPDLGGIYVSWAQPAQGVLSALNNAGNTKTKLVTLDLDDTIATNMARGGRTAALAADRAYDFGRAMAISSALAVLGKKAPEFGIVDSVTVTKDTLAQGYAAWAQPLPQAVKDALG